MITTKYIDQADLALIIASYAHNGQFRRDGRTPYINHPKDVASRVFKAYKNDAFVVNLMAVAYLHDVLEDTHIDSYVLRLQGIQERIICAVETLTKKPGDDYNEYLKRVKDDVLSQIVKIADMESNLADKPTQKQIEKYTKGLEFLRDNMNEKSI